MKVSEVLNETRKRLGDFDRIGHTLRVSDLILKIRAELDDAETEEIASGGAGVLKDFSYSLTEERILSDVKKVLGYNDESIEYSYGMSRLIQELREELDDGSDSELSTAAVLAKVRLALDGAGANETGAVNKVQVLSNVRLNLNDSVEPYRWTDKKLNEYIDSGCNEIQCRRKDACGKYNAVSSRFEGAVTAYVSARAFEHEAEDQSDAERSQYFRALYEKEIKDAPAVWLDADLKGFIAEGVQTIQNRRYALPAGVRYEQCVVDFALARAFEYTGDAEKFAAYNSKFEAELKEVPPHREDSEYRNAIENGIREVLYRRPDCRGITYRASETAVLNEKFVPCVRAWALGELKNRSEANGGADDVARFYSELAKIPFRWKEEELKRYLRDELGRVSDSETEVTSPVLPADDEYLEQLESYVLSRAYEQALSFGDYAEKYKLYRERYEAERLRSEKRYSESERKRVLSEGISALGRSDVKAVPALLEYVAYRTAVRNGNPSEAAVALQRYLGLKAELPKHWEDEELIAFLNSGVREIIRRRADCKLCEYEEFGETGEIPVSDKFETSLISYSVVRALEGIGAGDGEKLKFHVQKYESGLKEIPFHRPDAELLEAVNAGVREILRVRPDLRLDKHGYPVRRAEAANVNEEFSLSDDLVPAVSAYAAVRCLDEERRDEKQRMIYEQEFNHIIRGDA